MWFLPGHTSVTLIMLNDVVVIFLFKITSVVLNTLHLPLDQVDEHTRNQFRLSDLLIYNSILHSYYHPCPKIFVHVNVRSVLESCVLLGLRLFVSVNTFSVMLVHFPGLNQY